MPAGSTVVLRGGTYREGNISIGKQLTIEAYPHEQAWLTGSVVVTGWTQDGSNSRWDHTGWSYKPSRSTDAYASNISDPAYPYSVWPDMVFVNGVALNCVSAPNVSGRQGSVGSGSFYIDYAKKTIWIGNNPTNGVVEVSQYQTCFSSMASGTIIRGLGFKDYATAYKTYCAVAVGNNCTFDDNTVAWCACAGVSMNGTGITAKGNTFAFNGEEGASCGGLYNAVIASNNFAYNNVRNFSGYWDAAGFKMFGGSNVVISNNLFDHNNTNGCWIDGGTTTQVDIVNNTFLYNGIPCNGTNGDLSGSAIHYEYGCSNGIIANNLIVGSGYAGIMVGGEAQNVQVWNNTISGGEWSILVIDDSRAGHTSGVVVENNILSNSIQNSPMVNVANWGGSDTPSSMVSSLNYNAYYRTDASNPSTLISWGGTNYSNLAAFRSANHAYEANGIELSGGTNPFFVNEAGGNYTLKPGSPAIGAGAPLPGNVAAAIGVSAGVRVNMGVLSHS